jgi:hypothetical protein
MSAGSMVVCILIGLAAMLLTLAWALAATSILRAIARTTVVALIAILAVAVTDAVLREGPAKADAHELFRRWVAENPAPSVLQRRLGGIDYPMELLDGRCDRCFRPEWLDKVEHITTWGDPDADGTSSFYEVVRSCPTNGECVVRDDWNVALIPISRNLAESLTQGRGPETKCDETTTFIYRVKLCMSTGYAGDVIRVVEHTMDFEVPMLDLVARVLGPGPLEFFVANRYVDLLAGITEESFK